IGGRRRQWAGPAVNPGRRAARRDVLSGGPVLAPARLRWTWPFAPRAEGGQRSSTRALSTQAVYRSPVAIREAVSAAVRRIESLWCNPLGGPATALLPRPAVLPHRPAA